MQAFTQLYSSRVSIRRFQKSDQEPFVAILTDRRVTDCIALPEEMKTEEGAIKLLEMTIEAYDTANPLLAYALELRDSFDFLGMCGLTPLSEASMEVFYALMPRYWGQGYASETLGRLSAYIFSELAGHNIDLFITPENKASQRVALKNAYHNLGLVPNPNFPNPVFLFRKNYKAPGTISRSL